MSSGEWVPYIMKYSIGIIKYIYHECLVTISRNINIFDANIMMVTLIYYITANPFEVFLNPQVALCVFLSSLSLYFH